MRKISLIPNFHILSLCFLGSITQAFERIRKKAGIKNFRFHDLIHEATSHCFELGLKILEVASIAGHKNLTMLKRYTHLRTEDLAQKLN